VKRWENCSVLRNASLKNLVKWASGACTVRGSLIHRLKYSSHLVNVLHGQPWDETMRQADGRYFAPDGDLSNKGFTYSLRNDAQRGELTEKRKIWREEEEGRNFRGVESMQRGEKGIKNRESTARIG
jgi:hypothetical protein